MSKTCLLLDRDTQCSHLSPCSYNHHHNQQQKWDEANGGDRVGEGDSASIYFSYRSKAGGTLGYRQYPMHELWC